MKLYLKAFVVSLLAATAMVAPFLVYHGLALREVFGFTVAIAIVGPLVSLRHNSMLGVDKKRKEEQTYVYASFLPVFLSILQAVVWTAFRYRDAGTVMPEHAAHLVAIMSALLALASWVSFSVYLYRKKSQPNQPPL